MGCKRGILAALIAVAGLIAANPAIGQQSVIDRVISSDADREIVVTGQPDPEPEGREVNQQARSITQASNIFDEPLALFQKPICAGVSGLPVELATLVADRIRYNAERTGLKLAEAGNCRPNIMVAFVLDGQKALAKLADDGNSILARIPATERRALLQESGPVHAFTLWSYRTRDGIRPREDPTNQYLVIQTQSANSLFLLPSRKDIDMSVVLINLAAIDGMSAVQIADYASMRGLARTRPAEGNSTYGTILSLFNPDGSAPMELTPFDLAYLRTVYENQPNIAAATKIGAVKGAMRKVLAEEEAKE